MNKINKLLLTGLIPICLIGCFDKNNSVEKLEEKARRDSLRKVYDSTMIAEYKLAHTPDTLEIVLRQNPSKKTYLTSSDELYVSGETFDGKIKYLVFNGDELSSKISSLLVKGDTLRFSVPKLDLEKSVYDFYGFKDWILHDKTKKIISLNGKSLNIN